MNTTKARSNMTRGLAMGMMISLALIFIGVDGCDRADEGLSPPAKGQGPQRDRLFSKMGIIQVPHATVPVEISLPDLEGRMVRISDFRGKVVFLNFWTTWCPSCRVEMPSMQRLHARLRHRDFVMVAVNLQEPQEQVKGFFKEQGLGFISLLDRDGKVGTRFGIRSIPTTYILNREGRILGVAIGAREWDSKEAITLFEILMNDK